MILKKINIKNFRGIADAEFELSEKLNLFVGSNGAGKSTVIEAIVISLSWLVNRIQREGSSGRPITELNIKNQTPFSTIEGVLVEDDATFSWKIAKTQKGFEVSERSDLTQISDLASIYQHQSRERSILPVIAYYPVNRVVSSNINDNSKESLSVLDVYENALGGKTNYQAFFDWFKIQDDILNEKVSSRPKWMNANRGWIKRKMNKLLSDFQKVFAALNWDSDELNETVDRRFKRNDYLYEDPRFLLIEISDLVSYIAYSSKRKGVNTGIYDELESYLHKMVSLSDPHRNFNDGRNERRYSPQLDAIYQFLMRVIGDPNLEIREENTGLISFIWDIVLFSALMNLWWTTEKAKKQVEELFLKSNLLKRNQLQGPSPREFVRELDEMLARDLERYENASNNEGRELHYVTKAIEDFIPGYGNLRMTRVPKAQLQVDKNGETLNLEQLSDGEKNLIALIGDIARRLSIANPRSRNPMMGTGIILIDEIDLHLHPGWQRLMIPKLAQLFPNCQFILTSHSPQVISHAKPDDVFLLRFDNGEFSFSKATESYGKNTDRILEDLLGVDARPKAEKDMLHKLYRSIQDGNLQQASELINRLYEIIGEDPEISKAQALLKRKQIIGK